MRKTDVKKENPPVRLLGTMFLLVLGLVAVYVVLALGIFALVQQLVHLDKANYTLLWPILILTISAILGVLLAVFIFRGYLAPLSRLMQATQSVPPAITPCGWRCGVPGARWRSTSAASTKWRRSCPAWRCCAWTS